MGRKTMLIGGGIFLIVCFSFSLTSGQNMSSVKKSIVLPQGVEEKAIIEVCVKEGEKMRYDLKQEGDQYVLHKSYRPQSFISHKDQIYRIVMAISPGEDARKILVLETEFLGDASNVGWYGPNLYADVTKIENAVKNYLAAK
jgi:hypothetical protein